MESTRKKKTPLKNQEELKRRFGDENTQAPKGHWTSIGLRYSVESRRAFLIDLFKDLYGKEPGHEEDIQIIYVKSSGNGDDISVCDYPRKDKTHVFYNRQYFIELVPGEWSYSEPGEEFFEQQLKNIQLINSIETPISKWDKARKNRKIKQDALKKRTTNKKRRFIRRIVRGKGRIWVGRRRKLKIIKMRIKRHIDKCVDIWKDKGIIVKELTTYYGVSFNQEKEPISILPERVIPPRVCLYCGKEINPPPEEVFANYSSLDSKEKHTTGRYPEFCCDEHKDSQRRVKRYFEIQQKKGVIPSELEFDEMGLFGYDLERLLRPPCAYCGGDIPDDKRLGSKYCSDKCKDAFKHRIKKERETHPDITDEEVIRLLEKERIGGRRRDFWIRVLKEYLKTGGDPFDEAFDSVAFELRSYFQDEYPSIVARVREEIRKEKIKK